MLNVDWNQVLNKDLALILSTMATVFSLVVSSLVAIWTVKTNKNQELRKSRLNRTIPKLDVLYGEWDYFVENFGKILIRNKGNELVLDSQKYNEFEEKLRDYQNKLITLGIKTRKIKSSLKKLIVTLKVFGEYTVFSQSDEVVFYDKISKALTDLRNAILEYENSLFK